MKKILVIGSGGHAKVVIDLIESSTTFEIVGIVTKNQNIEHFMGYPVIGDDSVLDGYKRNGIDAIAIGVGGYKDNEQRENIYNLVIIKGFIPVTLVHHSVILGRDVSMGRGCVVFPGVVINTDVKIGNNVIVATSSSVDHETVVEDHVLISAGVTIGANTIIKKGALIALGAKIVSGVTIEEKIIIGAGAVVVNDCKALGMYLGIPAKMYVRD